MVRTLSTNFEPIEQYESLKNHTNEHRTSVGKLWVYTLYLSERISFKNLYKWIPDIANLKFIMQNASATNIDNKQNFCCIFNYAKRHLKSIRRINKWFDAIQTMLHCASYVGICTRNQQSIWFILTC